MDMFEFKARRPSGEVVSGKLNAANEAAVVSYIREQGMYATQIKKEVPKRKSFQFSFIKQKITLYDIAMFCRQFATLVGAGVSLVGAIEIMIEQTTNQRFKEIIQKVGDDVRKGLQLSAALAGFPDVFPILMKSRKISSKLFEFFIKINVFRLLCFHPFFQFILYKFFFIQYCKYLLCFTSSKPLNNFFA